MQQNTINSWGFFLDYASGDVLAQLASILNCHSYSPHDILNKLFEVYSDGVEFSYEGYLFSYLQRQNVGVKHLFSIEQMENAILAGIVSEAIKRCPEREGYLLLDLLGIEGEIVNSSISKEVIASIESIDGFKLTGLALLLIDPHYYKRLDFVTWPFRLNSLQYEKLYHIQKYSSISNESTAIVLLIAFHRSIPSSPTTTESTKGSQKSIKPGNNCVGRPKESWLTEQYATSRTVSQVEEILVKEHIWQKTIEWTKKVQYSARASRYAYKSLAAAILYYSLQRCGIAKPTRKSIPASFETTAMFLGKDVAEDLNGSKRAGPLSRASISPYLSALNDLFERMTALHLNGRWMDKKDIRQMELLQTGQSQRKVFLIESNIVWIGEAVDYLKKKLPQII